MRPFPWTSCSLEGMWSTQSCSLEPETSAPSLAAHTSSCPSQDTSGERCDSSRCCLSSITGVTACPRLGTGATPSTMHVGVPAPPLLPRFQLLLPPAPCCEQRARRGTPAPERPQLFSSRFSFLGLSCFPGVDGTETHAALYSDLVCPAHALPLQNTHTSAWNPDQCPHPPLPNPSHTTPGPRCSRVLRPHPRHLLEG